MLLVLFTAACGCSSRVNTDTLTLGGAGTLTTGGRTYPIHFLFDDDLDGWVPKTTPALHVGIDGEGGYAGTGDLGALGPKLAAQHLDSLDGDSYTVGESFAGSVTLDLYDGGASDPLTTQLTVADYEVAQVGNGDRWTTPPFLSLTLSGQSAQSTMTGTVTFALMQTSYDPDL